MKLLVGVVLLCFAAATSAAPRIVGGKDAPEGKYPYQVSLRYKERFFCGGSIINNRWILTLGHCLLTLGDDTITVVAGTNLLSGGGGRSYHSEYLSYHEDMENYKNDVGLIRVSEDIEFNDKVQPIALPKNEFYKSGDPVTLTGWGSRSLGDGASNKLQEIDLKIYDQDKCKKGMSFAIDITDSHICTYTGIEGGACFGDTGSPLVADGVQVGIVTFGVQCGRDLPEVFTRVYTFLDWIAAEQAKFTI